MTTPWLPGAAGRFLFAPMPTERLSALRLGAAVILLLDLVVTYLPQVTYLLGPQGSVGPHTTDWNLQQWLPTAWGGYAVLGLGILSALVLLTGRCTRLAAFGAWLSVVSLFHANPLLHNGGDRLRPLFFLILMFAGNPRTSTVPRWPALVLLVQVCCIYFFAGWAKLYDADWQNGSAMANIAANPEWSLAPHLAVAVPPWCWKLATWGTLLWELGFVVLAVLPRTRTVVLLIGIVFHILTLFLLDVGMFALWTPVCYLPLLPWEKLNKQTEPQPL